MAGVRQKGPGDRDGARRIGWQILEKQSQFGRSVAYDMRPINTSLSAEAMRYLICSVALILLAAATPARAQMSASDAVMRLEAIEHQMRQLTGQVEQLQHRNQQLEQQLRAMQSGGAPQPSRPQGMPQPQFQQQPQTMPGRRSDIEPAGNPTYAQPNVAPSPRQGAANQRGDVYDPRLDPSAPGAPRALGSLPPGQPSAPLAPDIAADEPIGARGGREAGAPLDISTLAGHAAGSGHAAGDQGLPPPPARSDNASPPPSTPISWASSARASSPSPTVAAPSNT